MITTFLDTVVYKVSLAYLQKEILSGYVALWVWFKVTWLPYFKCIAKAELGTSELLFICTNSAF